MYRLVLPTLFLAFASCGALTDVLDRTTLSDAELQDVKDNYQGAVRAFNDLEEFAASVANGTVDISGSTYDPPTSENGWVGTLRYQGPDFPGGDGDFVLGFTVLDQNGQPVDPFETDVTGDEVLTMDVGVDFLGTTAEGAPLELHADFNLVLDQSDPAREVVTLDGTFSIRHNDYVADLTARTLVFSYDPATGLVQEATGMIDGTIEIPGFAFDADVAIVAHGETASVDIAVLDQTIEDGVVSIADFQATGA